jgi:hypothetical protein
MTRVIAPRTPRVTSFALVGDFETGHAAARVGPSTELRVTEARAGKPLSACMGLANVVAVGEFGDIEIGGAEFFVRR